MARSTKATFFRVASTRTSSSSGRTIFKGRPGNPAPVPRSRTRRGPCQRGSLRRVRESRKCLTTTSSSPRRAVRLTFPLASWRRA